MFDQEESGDASRCWDSRPPPRPELLRSYSEVDMLLKKGYIVKGTIGEGTYSKVKQAFSKTLKREVAIKIISRDEAPLPFRERFLPREIQILSQVRHANIIQVFEIFETARPQRVYIVTELLDRGDLLELVKTHGAIDERRSRKIFADICRAMAHLHGNNIAHRDVKCENILLLSTNKEVATPHDEEYTAKLCDFGFARKFPDRGLGPEGKLQRGGWMTNTFCGSAAYAPPEILERKTHDPMSADVWAMGIVFFVTLYGSMPFDDTDIKTMVTQQKNIDLTSERPPEMTNVSDAAHQFIAAALRPNPKHRPEVAVLLRNPWLLSAAAAQYRHQQQQQRTPQPMQWTSASMSNRC